MAECVVADMSAVMRFAVKGLAEYRLDSIQDALTNDERARGLTVSLLETSKNSGSSGMLLEIAKCISVWEENKELVELRESILSCYAGKADISAVYLCKENQIVSFIVVMDDSTADTVFEYNEMGFILSGKYQAIKDFMIIDGDEAKGCRGLLEAYNLIYKRG